MHELDSTAKIRKALAGLAGGVVVTTLWAAVPVDAQIVHRQVIASETDAFTASMNVFGRTAYTRGASGVASIERSPSQVLGRSGEPAPGLPGDTLFGIGLSHVTTNGNVVWNASLDDGTGRPGDFVLYLDQTPIVRGNVTEVPDAEPGTVFLGANWSRAHGPTGILFTSLLEGPSLDCGNPNLTCNGIFLDLETVARTGDFAQTPAREYLTLDHNPPEFALAFGGIFAFKAVIWDGMDLSGATNRSAIYRGTKTPTLIAMEGQTGPGGITFDFLRSPVISRNTVVAFADSSNGVFVSQPGGLDALALTGDPAPGGGTYDGFGDPAASWKFIALLAGIDEGLESPTCAMLSTDTGPPSRIACTGDVAPGTAGLTLGQFRTFPPLVNACGSIAFHARLAGAGTTSGNDDAIFLYDRFGAGLLVVREGAAAPAAFGFPGTTITSIDLGESSPDAGGPVYLDDFDNVLYEVHLSNGAEVIMKSGPQNGVTCGNFVFFDGFESGDTSAWTP